MKQCSKCGSNKRLENFYRRKSGPRIGEYYEKCSDCYRKWRRNYYQVNRERQSKLARIRKHRYKEERRKFIERLKRDKPCMDCRRIYPPWIMDFDHRDGEIKITSISYMILVNTSNIEKIKREVAKCDLVCANCHRQRTHDRILKQKLAGIANVVKAPL